MELSARVEYALLALLKLTDRQLENKPLTVNEMAIACSIPLRYLDQILISLRQQGIVRSQRGVKGGYVLAKSPDRITLWEVVRILDGDNPASVRNASPTLEKTVVFDTWQQVAVAYQEVLGSYTLADLCKRLDNYRQDDSMYYI